MRTSAIATLGTILLVAGCATNSDTKKAKAGLTRSFYGRTIEYRLQPAAKVHLGKLENLLARSHDLEPPIPDNLVVRLYRDADFDRDHYITIEEADTFYNDFILKFEDSLGSVQYHAKDKR